MVNKTNLYEVIKNVRQVQEGQTPYQNTLVRHNWAEGQLWDLTEHNERYGKSVKERTDGVIRHDAPNQDRAPAGYVSRDKKQQGLKINSVLTGELYKSFDDPKDNVFIQRTWLYSQDQV